MPVAPEKERFGKFRRLVEPPRRIVTATSGGDLSHDGKRLAVFQLDAGRTVLSILTRDGSSATRTNNAATGFHLSQPTMVS